MRKVKTSVAAFGMALALTFGVVGAAQEVDLLSQEQQPAVAAGSVSSDFWSLEDQMKLLLENDSVSGELVVDCIEKILIVRPLDAQKVDEYAAQLQSGTACAAMQADAPQDQAASLGQQVAALLAGSRLSAEEKSTVLQMIGQSNAGRSDGIMPYGIIDTSEIKLRSLNVPFYKQETRNYCGPATTKQTLQFLNGTSETQDAYADLVGAWSSSKGRYFDHRDKSNGYASATERIVPVVNARQNKAHYLAFSKSELEVSFDDMKAVINCAIANNRPAIFNIVTPNGITPNEAPNDIDAAWPYTTSSGHFLNISGQFAFGNGYYLTDPYYKYNDVNSDGKFKRSNVRVYEVYRVLSV